ncbi:MAG: hypothetical protein ACK4F7_02105 [Inhella sp.]
MRLLPRILLCTLLPSLLSGCAMLKDSWSTLSNMTNAYQEPVDGPRLRMRLSLGQIGTYRIYPAATCIDHAQPGSGVAFFNDRFHVPVPSLSHTKELRDLGVPGMELSKGFESRDLRLRAGQPVVIGYWTSDAEGEYRYGCHAAHSFVPREGADYQAVATWNAPRLRNAGCRLTVFELTPAGPLPVEAALAPMCSAMQKP